MLISHYEINVSKNGSHYFATDARSLRTRTEADMVYFQLQAAFPLTKGYAVSMKSVAVQESMDVTPE